MQQRGSNWERMWRRLGAGKSSLGGERSRCKNLCFRDVLLPLGTAKSLLPPPSWERISKASLKEMVIFFFFSQSVSHARRGSQKELKLVYSASILKEVLLWGTQYVENMVTNTQVSITTPHLVIELCGIGGGQVCCVCAHTLLNSLLCS